MLNHFLSSFVKIQVKKTMLVTVFFDLKLKFKNIKFKKLNLIYFRANLMNQSQAFHLNRIPLSYIHKYRVLHLE